MADLITLENGLRVRHGIGMLIRDPSQTFFLAGLRAGKDEWQLPQGGREVDDVKMLGAEAAREMREELGIMPQDVMYFAKLAQTTYYELPDDMRARGFDAQRHHWLIYTYQRDGLPDLTQATDKEFDEVAWRPLKWILPRTSDFRVPVYRRVKLLYDTAQFEL